MLDLGVDKLATRYWQLENSEALKKQGIDPLDEATRQLLAENREIENRENEINENSESNETENRVSNQNREIDEYGNYREIVESRVTELQDIELELSESEEETEEARNEREKVEEEARRLEEEERIKSEEIAATCKRTDLLILPSVSLYLPLPPFSFFYLPLPPFAFFMLLVLSQCFKILYIPPNYFASDID